MDTLVALLCLKVCDTMLRDNQFSSFLCNTKISDHTQSCDTK